MSDATESARRVMQAEHNVAADPERAAMEERWGQVWTTAEMQKDFSVLSFLAPFVVVTRKSDGVKGSMTFSHRPRWYYDFRPQTPSAS